MSAGGGGGGKKKKRGGEGFHPDERWLLTYADMITLLMALFIILWAMSTTSADKFDALKLSLTNAFGSPLFVGQDSILQGGPGSTAKVEPVTPQDAVMPDQQKSTGGKTEAEQAATAAELQDLQKIKDAVDKSVTNRGIAGKVKTTIDERGLVIRILPDNMLFATGEADLFASARPVLDDLVKAVKSVPRQNPIHIEGHTDDVPIATARFRNNWELATSRAVTVLSVFLEDGITPGRMTAAGFADTRPIAPNDTAEGRAENRRVEIVVVRTATEGDAAGTTTTSVETTTVAPPAAVPAITPLDSENPIGISPDAVAPASSGTTSGDQEVTP
ncbi:MAG: flagellar motor protein MotB [Thermoleophilia bacterium]